MSIWKSLGMSLIALDEDDGRRAAVFRSGGCRSAGGRAVGEPARWRFRPTSGHACQRVSRVRRRMEWNGCSTALARAASASGVAIRSREAGGGIPHFQDVALIIEELREQGDMFRTVRVSPSARVKASRQHGEGALYSSCPVCRALKEEATEVSVLRLRFRFRQQLCEGRIAADCRIDEEQGLGRIDAHPAVVVFEQARQRGDDIRRRGRGRAARLPRRTSRRGHVRPGVP